MKLLPVIVAVAKAQIDLPDLSNFDLSAFGLGPGTPINFPDAADEERYFFTTVLGTTTTLATTTTTLPVQGTSCWKCDEMTYTTCASGGEYTFCESGDKDCCFVEVRETSQQLQQLCTGCKDATACMDMKAENNIGSFLQHQCRSDYRLQRIGRNRGQQSVCRQCFNTCDPSVDKTHCFGSIDSVATTPNVMLTLSSDKANFPWTTAYTGANQLAFGIPTGAKLDSSVDGTVIGQIQTFHAAAGESTLNVWFKSLTDGKADVSDGANGREASEMTYWGLQGADSAWWNDNLKTIQDVLKPWGAAVPFTAAGFNN